MRPILVVGATGLLGSEVCRLLYGSKHLVRALVRPGSDREEQLRRMGIEVVHGDLTDPRSLEVACRGVTTVVSTATGAARRLPGDNLRRVDRDGQRALVDAARRGGVRRFVYTSLSPNLPRSTPLVKYKREVESAVKGSGMAWVIVQPSAFMETWLAPRAGIDVATGRAALLGSGETPVSYVSVRDVARVIASVVDHPEVSRTYLPVGGPDALTSHDAVRLFEQESSRRLAVVHAPSALARGMALLLRPFDGVLSSMLGVAAHMAEVGDVVEPSKVVWGMLSEPVTVRDHARMAARAALTQRVRVLLSGAGTRA
ncbi:MAG TPA: SDR family oxidoreductase [Candidatus Polarisedimenticolia bacterium]|nr:SDR family oxidoreductase [Candidatus Polarisedimenticolia bacterium]